MITENDIKRYITMFPKAGWAVEEAPLHVLAAMANWFAEGQVTALSNHIMAKTEFGGRLQYDIAEGCRGGCCREWQIIDDEERVVDRADALWDFVKR
jgi:hypothetical protein